MFNHKKSIVVLATALFVLSTGFSQVIEKTDLEKDWDEFLSYTLVRNMEMAKGHAQAILNNDPDPVLLHKLSEDNYNGYQILLIASKNDYDAELANLANQIIELINKGASIRRSDPQVIYNEVKRLSSNTDRGRLTAVERLRNAGEYAVPFMLNALADPAREEEFANIARALPELSKDAIRPLAAALQTGNPTVRSEIVKAMGGIKYPQSLPYLKYVLENEESLDIRQSAEASIKKIDPSALSISAAQLFYQLAENYYYHSKSLAPEDTENSNIWFWDSSERKLSPEVVNNSYFNELMAMRACEWALKSDANYGPAIGLWLASYFKAESAGVAKLPEYFGESHANALVYATTAGVEYLHQALARAIKDGNTYVALGVIEALGKTAGEKSLFYRLGTEQPLIDALSFKDRLVRYSAAIAIAAAEPQEKFVESKLVVANLAEALIANPQIPVDDAEIWSENIANSYAIQAATVMLELARTRNPAIDLSIAQSALINATNDESNQIKMLAAQTLAHLKSPTAQNAIVMMALDTANDNDVRVLAFNSLTVSAKVNANMLADEVIDRIYELISSDTTDVNLRSAAASAYGALNLPSRKVKDLILDQSKS